MTALGAFQRDFAAALLDPSRAMPPAFAVYRNTVMKGLVDALEANYPSVSRLVGEEWFRAAAATYARAHPPATPVLATYGATFPDFLVGFEPARELPYLPAVARLDRFWTEAHVAADATAAPPQVLASLAPEDLGDLRLVPHPSARWACFDLPAYSLWVQQREEREGEVDWRPEGALLVRPADTVQWHPLEASGVAFLDACARGVTLAEAADAALHADPAADLALLLSRLLAAGALVLEEEKETS